MQVSEQFLIGKTIGRTQYQQTPSAGVIHPPQKSGILILAPPVRCHMPEMSNGVYLLRKTLMYNRDSELFPIEITLDSEF
eukprot:COSAG02_NODE_7781_length_2848_cov_7.058931_4_plen_80_part_00